MGFQRKNQKSQGNGEKKGYTEIGALWEYNGKNENIALTGELNHLGIKISIMVCPNERAKSQKEPQYKILSFGIKGQTGSSSPREREPGDDDEGAPF
jgi:uncharacterized protein (DUF736 family)